MWALQQQEEAAAEPRAADSGEALLDAAA